MRTLATLLLVLSLAACGGSKKPAATPPPAEAAPLAEPPTPVEGSAPADDAEGMDKSMADPDEGGESK